LDCCWRAILFVSSGHSKNGTTSRWTRTELFIISAQAGCMPVFSARRYTGVAEPSPVVLLLFLYAISLFTLRRTRRLAFSDVAVSRPEWDYSLPTSPGAHHTYCLLPCMAVYALHTRVYICYLCCSVRPCARLVFTHYWLPVAGLLEESGGRWQRPGREGGYPAALHEGYTTAGAFTAHITCAALAFALCLQVTHRKVAGRGLWNRMAGVRWAKGGMALAAGGGACSWQTIIPVAGMSAEWAAVPTCAILQPAFRLRLYLVLPSLLVEPVVRPILLWLF